MDSNILTETEIERARQTGRELRDRWELDARLERFEPYGWDGRLEEAPTLHLEDLSQIPFIRAVPGVEEYQHRARVRAGEGDLFAAVTPPADGYQDYTRERLGLGEPAFVQARALEDDMAVADACRRGDAWDRILNEVRPAGALEIHPYMSVESVWALADQCVDAGLEAQVVGPPPPTLWVANDKAQIARLARALGHPEWNPEVTFASSPDEMTDALMELAERYDRVGLKRTRCTSAMGNAVFDSADLLEGGAGRAMRRVERFLDETEWEGDEEVLLVEWVDALHSPSTQLWLPPDGPPEVEGIYEQLVKGDEGVFVGSRPSTLADDVNERLAEISVTMAAALQEMGYTGRCSFDFIVGREGDADAVKLVECNGRWGGASTPMRLVDRLIPDERPDYIARDVVHPELVGAPFREVRDALGDELFDPSTGEGRFALYNPGPLAKTGKVDVVAVGESPADARWAMEERLPDLLGLDEL